MVETVAPPRSAARRLHHARALLRLGMPLIGSHLAQLAIQITDTVMLGWYDIEALAAVVLGSSYFFVFFIMGSGFAWAVSPVVAAAEASGDETQVRRVTRMGMWLSMLFAIAAMPLMIFAAPILSGMGQEAGLSEQAGTYLAISGWALFPALIVMTLKSYLAALERVRAVLLVTIAAALLNALLNYALIFGNWGAPELGIAGAAIASVSLHSLAMVLMVVHVIRSMPQHELFVRIWRPDWEAFARIFRLGWPIGLTSLAEVGLFAASALMMGWIGTIELAAHGIALQIASATFLVHLGLSNAAQIRVAAALGRRDPASLREGALVAVALSTALALATVAVFLSVPELLVGLFLDPTDPAVPQVMAVGVTLLALAALFQLADAAQVMALGLLRGVQDTRVPMVYAGISYWAVGLTACYVLGFPMGLGAVGVWLGLTLGLTLAGVLLMVRFWRRVAPAPVRAGA